MAFSDETRILNTDACQEDEENFDREFSIMVADSVHSRASERIPVFDMPLPMRSKPRPIDEIERPNADSRDDSESMKFMLLSKKGSKATVGVTNDLLSVKLLSCDDRPVRSICPLMFHLQQRCRVDNKPIEKSNNGLRTWF